MNTGIFMPEEIVQKFSSEMKENDSLRWLQLLIEDEKFVIGKSEPKGDDFGSEYSKMRDAVQNKKASYFILRLDVEPAEFLLVWYVPGNASVYEKMLYSTTLKNVLTGFGQNTFVGNYHTTKVSELSIDGFDWEKGSKEYKDDEEKEEYMTEEERMLQEERHGSSTVHQLSGGKSLNFPVEDVYINALESIQNGSSTFVMAKIENEKIVLDKEENVSAGEDIIPHLPVKEPRFVLYRFAHEFEGEQQNPIVFLYTCPGKSSVKNKMIYSSTKGTILSLMAEQNISLGKSLESNDLKELTQEFFLNSLHPKKLEKKFNFEKPKRPGRKTGRRNRKLNFDGLRN